MGRYSRQSIVCKQPNLRLMSCGKSLLIAKNKSGPKTVPWDTPDRTLTSREPCPSTRTRWGVGNGVNFSIITCANPVLGEKLHYNNTHIYGVPFSHLFTELQISAIEVHISPIELEISTIHLQISTIHLEISPNRLNCRYLQFNWRYLQFNWRYLQFNWRYLQIGPIWRYLQFSCRYLQFN